VRALAARNHPEGWTREITSRRARLPLVRTYQGRGEEGGGEKRRAVWERSEAGMRGRLASSEAGSHLRLIDFEYHVAPTTPTNWHGIWSGALASTSSWVRGCTEERLLGRVVGRTGGLRGVAGDRGEGFGVGGERVGSRTPRGAAGGPGGGDGAAAIGEERRERSSFHDCSRIGVSAFLGLVEVG